MEILRVNFVSTCNNTSAIGVQYFFTHFKSQNCVSTNEKLMTDFQPYVFYYYYYLICFLF